MGRVVLVGVGCVLAFVNEGTLEVVLTAGGVDGCLLVVVSTAWVVLEVVCVVKEDAVRDGVEAVTSGGVSTLGVVCIGGLVVVGALLEGGFTVDSLSIVLAL